MTNSHNSHLEGAIQALVWAIEDIAKTGNKKGSQFSYFSEVEHHPIFIYFAAAVRGLAPVTSRGR